MAESVTEVVLEALGVYLKANVKGTKQIITGFPEANINLKYPSISIHTKAPTFSNRMPYAYSQGQVSNAQADVKWVVGQYDWEIQVDLWERTQEERDDFFELFFRAMHKNVPVSSGVILSLDDYHGNTCEYTMVGYQDPMEEMSSQRKEWRASVDLRANCLAIVENEQYIITQGEVQLQSGGKDNLGANEEDTTTVF